jgi:2-dehydropantoate 2-reductase
MFCSFGPKEYPGQRKGKAPKTSKTMPTVHLYGNGPLSLLLATSLRASALPVGVCLILPSHRLYRAFQELRSVYTCVNWDGNGYLDGYNTDGIRSELAPALLRRHGRIMSSAEFNEAPLYQPHLDAHVPGTAQQDEVAPFDRNTQRIDYLIMAMKPQKIVSALLSIKHRIGAHTSILVIHVGMGVIEQICAEVFPDPAKRPCFLMGQSSHGVENVTSPVPTATRKAPIPAFQYTHAQRGALEVSLLPRNSSRPLDAEASREGKFSEGQQFLMEVLRSSPNIMATEISAMDMHLGQLDGLAVRSVINPVTALLDGPVGSLLHNYSLTRVSRLLLAEISLVLRSLPELRGHPEAETRFDAARLEGLVVQAATRGSRRLPAMARDTRMGHKTEIDYLNGYVVKRGEEMGVKCFLNYMVAQLVRGKQQMISLEKDGPEDADDYEGEIPLLSGTE